MAPQDFLPRTASPPGLHYRPPPHAALPRSHLQCSGEGVRCLLAQNDRGARPCFSHWVGGSEEKKRA